MPDCCRIRVDSTSRKMLCVSPTVLRVAKVGWGSVDKEGGLRISFMDSFMTCQFHFPPLALFDRQESRHLRNCLITALPVSNHQFAELGSKKESHTDVISKKVGTVNSD
ncbi:hypothetical protein ACLOJK_001237 [Asimina triloba]